MWQLPLAITTSPGGATDMSTRTVFSVRASHPLHVAHLCASLPVTRERSALSLRPSDSLAIQPWPQCQARWCQRQCQWATIACRPVTERRRSCSYAASFCRLLWRTSSRCSDGRHTIVFEHLFSRAGLGRSFAFASEVKPT